MCIINLIICPCTMYSHLLIKQSLFSTQVCSVVQEQIVRALKTQPGTVEQFKIKLNALPYTEILKIWHMEKREREEWESQAKPIL